MTEPIPTPDELAPPLRIATNIPTLEGLKDAREELVNAIADAISALDDKYEAVVSRLDLAVTAIDGITARLGAGGVQSHAGQLADFRTVRDILFYERAPLDPHDEANAGALADDEEEEEERGCPQCGSTNARDGKCRSCGYHDGMLSEPGGDKL